MDDFFAERQWKRVARFDLPSRKGERRSAQDLALPPSLRGFIDRRFEGLYLHQHRALASFLAGEDVCLCTGTASGKSLVFQLAACRLLEEDPRSRILAIYPTKSLGNEQEDRWRAILADVGIRAGVGRIDGGVPPGLRTGILKESRILVMTPDVIHAWMLGRVSDPAVLEVLGHLALLVVDEVHVYTGVLGSNLAFLARRLLLAAGVVGSTPRIVAASATISDPARHLKGLFGRPFTLILPGEDSSPRQPVSLELLQPDREASLLDDVVELIRRILTTTASRLVLFANTRRMVERIGSLVARDARGEKSSLLDRLESLEVLPFRAGYEAEDRDLILGRLRSGSLRGVLSTSALELGMDIADLDLAILLGVPPDQTSFLQRMGRVGRQAPGRVLVISTGSGLDTLIFRRPESVLRRPPLESALYLENRRIQYIHAQCLASERILSGERGTATAPRLAGPEVEWPPGFLDLCEQIDCGESSSDLVGLKLDPSQDPHLAFPLRDVETQFPVRMTHGPPERRMGSISLAQALREAYPGAVHYYAGAAFRVVKVQMSPKSILVKKEKQYFTTPEVLPTMVSPRIDEGGLLRGWRHGELLVVECDLTVREAITGFKERRGSTEIVITYPSREYSHFQPTFTRFFSSTGVTIWHPLFEAGGTMPEGLSPLLLDSFLSAHAFERQDIGSTLHRQRRDRGFGKEGEPFLTLYDRTYGSLRLSGRILEEGVLLETLRGAKDLVDAGESGPSELGPLLEVLMECVIREPREPVEVKVRSSRDLCTTSGTEVDVILPGSVGIDVRRQNEVFLVEDVIQHPSIPGLAYRGKHASSNEARMTTIIPVGHVSEIPGESETGVYHTLEGTIRKVDRPSIRMKVPLGIDPSAGPTEPSPPSPQPGTGHRGMNELVEELRAAGEWPDPTMLEAILEQGEEAVAAIARMVETDITDWASLRTFSILAGVLGDLGGPEAASVLIGFLRRDDDELALAASHALAGMNATTHAGLEGQLLAILSEDRLGTLPRCMSGWVLLVRAGDNPGRRAIALRLLRAALVRSQDPARRMTRGWSHLPGALAALLAEAADEAARPLILKTARAWEGVPLLIDESDVNELFRRGPRSFVPPQGRWTDTCRSSFPMYAAGSSETWTSQTRASHARQALERAKNFGYRLPTGSFFPIAPPEALQGATSSPKVGRNDRCPCGSGLKFKKCCLSKVGTDRPPTASRTSRPTGVQRILDILSAFGTATMGSGALEAAWDEFWGGHPLHRNIHRSIFGQLFVPWFLLLWTPDDPGAHDGLVPPWETTIAAQFRKSQDIEDPALLSTLEGMRSEPLSFWEVEDLGDGSTLRFHDLATGRRRQVAPPPGLDVRRWQIILGQIADIEGTSVLLSAGPVAFSSWLAREDILAEIQLRAAGRPMCVPHLFEYDFEFIDLYTRLTKVGE